MPHPLVPSPASGRDGSGPMSWWVRAHIMVVALAAGTMCLTNTAFPPAGTHVTGFIPLTAGLVLWSLVIAALLAGREDVIIGRWSWTTLGAGSALWVYALISTTFRQTYILVGNEHARRDVPGDLTALPTICGLLALWSAFAIVIATPQRHRFALLWWLSLALVPFTLLGWWRTYLLGGGPRLWNQAGGAAVYPVILLVTLAVSLAAVVGRFRTRVSLLMSVAHLVMLILTGSRGGLLALVVMAVLVVVRLGRRTLAVGRHARRVPRRVWIMAGALVMGSLLLSPLVRRVLTTHDQTRLMTWQVGLRALGDDPARWLFGLGSGTIWPWFAYESGWQPVPYLSQAYTPWGLTLTSPHSLYLGVLAELGLVGILVLLAMLTPVVIAWRRASTAAETVLTSAATACLVAFAFDTFLLKNFPVGWVWWLLVFTVLSNARRSDVSPTRADQP